MNSRCFSMTLSAIHSLPTKGYIYPFKIPPQLSFLFFFFSFFYHQSSSIYLPTFFDLIHLHQLLWIFDIECRTFFIRLSKGNLVGSRSLQSRGIYTPSKFLHNTLFSPSHGKKAAIRSTSSSHCLSQSKSILSTFFDLIHLHHLLWIFDIECRTFFICLWEGNIVVSHSLQSRGKSRGIYTPSISLHNFLFFLSIFNLLLYIFLRSSTLSTSHHILWIFLEFRTLFIHLSKGILWCLIHRQPKGIYTSSKSFHNFLFFFSFFNFLQFILLHSSTSSIFTTLYEPSI